MPEFDRDGNVVRSYGDPEVTRDFHRLPDGNRMVVVGYNDTPADARVR